jgi:predicted PurR-regulated permease PerM
MTKQLVRFGLAVMTAFLVIAVLWQFRTVLAYLVASVVLAAAMRPMINHLAGRRFAVVGIWILVYLAALGGFVVLLLFSIDAAISEIQLLAQRVAIQDTWMLPTWLEGSAFQRSLMARIPPPTKLFEAITGQDGELILPVIFGFMQDITKFVTGIFVILILSIYWSINQDHFERLWLSLLPSDQRKQVRGIWRTIEPETGAYIRSQVIHSVLAGLLFGLGFWLIGSPYPAFLALVGAIACLIPLVGSVLALTSILSVSLLTSVQLSVFMIIYTLAILIALRIWVKPRLFNRQRNNEVLTLVLLVGLADAFGLLGLIVAPPLSAVCQIVWNRAVRHREDPGAADQISDLKERQIRLWDTLNTMEMPPPPLVISSMEQLAELTAKAEPVLQAAQSMKPFKPSIQIVPQTEVEDPNLRG